MKNIVLTALGICLVLSNILSQENPTIENSNGKRVIIFVHGFGGQKDSWKGTSEHFYERFSAIEEIKENYKFDIYEYPTKKVEFRFFKIIKSYLAKKTEDRFNTGLRDISNELYGYIKAKYSDYESIVFITHSMGGLVVKKTMVKMKPSELTKVKFYVSMSVPHRGSSLGKIGRKLVGRNNPQFKDLELFSDFTNELTERYSNIENPPFSLYQYGYNDKVVNEGSAIPDKVNRIATRDTHYTCRLIKDPENNTLYMEIKKKLLSIIHDIPSYSGVPKIIFSPERENNQVQKKVLSYFNDFSFYLSRFESISIPDKYLDFYIGDSNSKCDGSYYFAEKQFKVSNDIIAMDKDLINRIHMHSVLHESVKDRIEIDEFYSERQTGDYPVGGIAAALESGICDFFASAYSNDPIIGEMGFSKCTETSDKLIRTGFLRDISKPKEFKNIPYKEVSFYEQGHAWSNLFWELHKKSNDANQIQNLTLKFWRKLWYSSNSKNFREWNLEHLVYIFFSVMGEEVDDMEYLVSLLQERGITKTDYNNKD